MLKAACFALALLVGAATPVHAQLQPEELKMEQLAEAMKPHWVWLNDISFDRMADGRAYLLDADTGKMLGMVSSGYSHGALLLSPDGKSFASLSTYYSRGSRGERTDVATFYKTSDLAPGEEVILPPKRFSGMPFLASSPVMPGGRFGMIYNFSPEQSVAVLDLTAKKLVGEFPTPGCGLIYPTAPQKFFLICSDGSLQPATLDATGKVFLGKATAALFDAEDPVTEKGVWTGQEWLFFTKSGKVHVIDHSRNPPVIRRSWPLAGKDDAGWRPGALQTGAYHPATGLLYVLMHQGGPETYKDPGTEIWVYDAAKGVRVKRLKLDTPAMSVAISQDSQPLLYTTMFGETSFKVRDPATGKVIRQIEGLGPTMTLIQPAPAAVAR